MNARHFHYCFWTIYTNQLRLKCKVMHLSFVNGVEAFMLEGMGSSIDLTKCMKTKNNNF